MAMESGAPFLSEEIITNILKRLPVKSLIRFECVCKHWKNIIKNPSFIADHLHHSSQNPSLLFRRFGEDHPLELYLLHCEMQVRQVHDAPLIDSIDSYHALSSIEIIGSCNGLLCVEIYVDYTITSLLLWNPAIRKVIQVPGSTHYIRGGCYPGFGFSPIVNDYRIVRIYANVSYVVNRVEIYSLSTRSWKEIEFGNLEGVKLDSEIVTTNGVIFWCGSKLGVEEEGRDDFHLIVSFDIAMEVFTLVRKPALYPNSIANLTVYKNNLAMLCHIRSFELIDLWVMVEVTGAFGERWSWTKKYTINSSPGMLYPFSIWGNEIVCTVDETEEEIGDISFLSLLNPNTYELKKFAIGRSWFEFSVISNHVESLIPVDNSLFGEP